MTHNVCLSVGTTMLNLSFLRLLLVKFRDPSRRFVMFRNDALGTSVVGRPDDWPKLGEDSEKRKPGQPKNRPTSSSRRCAWKPSQPATANDPQPPKPESSSSNVVHSLDSSNFPVLGKFASRKPQKEGKSLAAESQKKTRKKRVKKSSPLQIDICEIIQASALMKKQKSEISALKKSSKVKRKILSGNLLDSSQPKRYKGKFRPWKRKDLSKTKKIICASRKVRLSRSPFPRDVLRFKENLGLALKKGEVEVAKLADDLTRISLGGAAVDKSIDSADMVAIRFAKDIIHNKKFRSYCNNIVTQELKKQAGDLIVTLRKFQDRLHAKDEVKAHAKRRYVCGFNESTKFLLADRVKLLIVATNLEMEEGLPSMSILKKMTDAAEERNVPVIYGGLAQNIGYWALKKAKISVLAVMNYEGANETQANLMKSWNYAKEEYKKLLEKITTLFLFKSYREVSQEAVKKEVEEEIKETILSKLKE